MVERIKKLINHRFFIRESENIGYVKVIWWWEKRRLPYNVLVGVAGIVTILALGLIVVLIEQVLGKPVDMGSPLVSIVGIIVYGVVANIFLLVGGSLKSWCPNYGEKKGNTLAPFHSL